MPADLHRVVLAGVQAALQESRAESERNRHHLPARRALLVGAGLVTAARLATSGRGRGMLGTLQNGVTRLQDQLTGEDEYEPEDEEDIEDDEDLEQPEGEEELDEPEDEEDIEE
jgi:hypothetical protein